MAGVDGWLPMWDMVDTVGVRLNQAEHDALTTRRRFLISRIPQLQLGEDEMLSGLLVPYLAELSALNKVLG